MLTCILLLLCDGVTYFSWSWRNDNDDDDGMQFLPKKKVGENNFIVFYAHIMWKANNDKEGILTVYRIVCSVQCANLITSFANRR